MHSPVIAISGVMAESTVNPTKVNKSSNATIMDPPYGGSMFRTATTTYNKPRQRGLCVYMSIELHFTAPTRPVMLIFQCYLSLH